MMCARRAVVLFFSFNTVCVVVMVCRVFWPGRDVRDGWTMASSVAAGVGT